jgi:hypothetical protein
MKKPVPVVSIVIAKSFAFLLEWIVLKINYRFLSIPILACFPYFEKKKKEHF